MKTCEYCGKWDGWELYWHDDWWNYPLSVCLNHPKWIGEHPQHYMCRCKIIEGEIEPKVRTGRLIELE
jgi:hypothetical protein